MKGARARKNILPVIRPETWAKEKHPEPDLTPGPVLEISPIPELVPESGYRIPPVSEVPELKMSPIPEHKMSQF